MSEERTKITYEILRELRKNEASSRKLQSLTSDILPALHDYIESRQKSYEESLKSVDSYYEDILNDKRREIEHARVLIKQLFTSRDRKLLKLALNDALSGKESESVNNMLPQEFELYRRVKDLLREFIAWRSSVIFGDGDHGENPFLKEKVLKTEVPSTTPGPGQSKGSDTLPGTVKIKLLEAIPQVVGPDKLIYGPYEKGEVVELPARLAEILIRKKKAEEVV